MCALFGLIVVLFLNFEAPVISPFELYDRRKFLPALLDRKSTRYSFDNKRHPMNRHRNPMLADNGAVVDGGWSEWSPWSECQVTCGSGFRVANRWCNNPEPANGGKDCGGPQVKKEPCSVKVHCPVNGGWGAWTPWKCSVSCAGGIATRTRECNKPKPLYGGVCLGNSSETWDTPCNAFTCPPVRRVSNSTLTMLKEAKKNLKVQMFAFDEGTSTSRLQCGKKELLDSLLWDLKTDVKKAVEWKKNGHSFIEDKSRTDKGMFTIDFKKAAYEDSGFYTCEVGLLGGGKHILKAFSLIVNTAGFNYEVEKGQPFELECNSLVLSSIYPNSHVSWYFNNTLHASFNDTPAALTNSLKFAFAMENMTGTWTCKTYEIDTGEKAEKKEEKSFVGRLKDKLFGSKEEKEKKKKEKLEKKRKNEEKKSKKSKFLNPIANAKRRAKNIPKVVEGHVWITNVIKIRVKEPKSLQEKLRSPQFMGLCAGIIAIIVVIIIALIQGKLTKIMGSAEKNMQQLEQLKAEEQGNADG